MASPSDIARSRGRSAIVTGLLVATAVLLLPATASAAGRHGCVRLAWAEGDVSGFSNIYDEDAAHTLGFVEYGQHRHDDTLEIFRVARFSDGSSDEDRVEARLGEYLETVRGQTILRNAAGAVTLDVVIDVGAGTIRGYSGLGHHREDYDEQETISPCTYWGPLLGIVLKNFDANADDDGLEVRTVVMTPTPRLIRLQFDREERMRIGRVGGGIDVERISMVPKVNFLLNPLLRFFGPETSFYMRPGSPPSMARFVGPRNYQGQTIRIE